MGNEALRVQETVRLRDVEEADLEFFYAHEHDPENVRRSKFQPRGREQFMTHWRTRILGDPAVFVQTALVDGAVAGGAVAWWEGERRFIGYVFGREFWGRGIGTKVLRQFLLLEQTRPLYADPYAGNTGSCRLLEKMGFKRGETVLHGDNAHLMYTLRS
ncbi:GNAT family N-acetyltransferase [Streptomyces sp. NPDC051940]|uniref:GNAT family N-acetyltransferase n=1 Tax=Streptomyces sp. NPDC051940 TaxID=3155675 RepID=UPI003412D7F2